MNSEVFLITMQVLIALMIITLLCGFFIYLILINSQEKIKLQEKIKKQEKMEHKQENMNAKYIKTQAGIYEIKNGKFLGGLDVEKYSKDFPVRFADNIEELCDEFIVVFLSDGSRFVTSSIDIYRKLVKNPEIDLYGAIWTDDGLIYVTKMNGKGEFELLYDK